RRRAGLVTEEVHEDAPARPHVLIDGDAEHLSAAQDLQRGPGGSAVGDLADAGARAIGHQPTAEHVPEGARNDGELQATAGRGPRLQLEIAEVSDGRHHPFGTRAGMQQLPRVEADGARELLVPQRQEDLGEAPPELNVAGAADLLPLSLAERGKCAAEAVERDRAPDAQDPPQHSEPLAKPQERLPQSTSSRALSRTSSPRRMRTSTRTATMPAGSAIRTRAFSVVTGRAPPASRRRAVRSSR